MEAVALAETNGFPQHASLAAAVLALCSAVVGDRQLCERAAVLLSDVAEPERRALGPFGLGYLAYNEGRYAEADAYFRQVDQISPVGRGLIRWETEWLETLIRAGRRQKALNVLAILESEVPPRVLRLHGIGRVKGMLAPDLDTAAGHFTDTVTLALRIDDRFNEGRTEIAWGERLRRARRRAEARNHLERAVELLRGIGATAVADHATRELRAAGGLVGDDTASHHLLVTARATSRPPRRRRSLQPRPRRDPLSQPTHDRGTPHGNLPQTRCQQPPRTRRQGDDGPDPQAVTDNQPSETDLAADSNGAPAHRNRQHHDYPAHLAVASHSRNSRDPNTASDGAPPHLPR